MPWTKLVPYTIPLTRGRLTTVDAIRYKKLNRNKWQYNGQYAVATINKKTVYLHRVVLNAPEGAEVDHINGDKLDNRRENLRFCTRSQNNANKPKQSNNKSRYKGVYWFKHGKKWHARIGVDGKRIHLGYYKTESGAALAYNSAATEFFGKFAQLNTL